MFSHTTGFSALLYNTNGPANALNLSISSNHTLLRADVPVNAGEQFGINIIRGPGYCKRGATPLLLQLEVGRERMRKVVLCSEETGISWTLEGRIDRESGCPAAR